MSIIFNDDWNKIVNGKLILGDSFLSKIVGIPSGPAEYLLGNLFIVC